MRVVLFIDVKVALGFEINRSESMLIQEVVGKLFRKLNRTYEYASVAKDLVGMDSRMQKVIELLDLGMADVRVVGIWGMGGIGKTTISGAVYDYISWKFDGSVIKNVREVLKNGSLKALQGQLISEILMEKDFTVRSDGHAVHMIKDMVCRKKVLIVLDDVDELTDLKKLLGEHDWFCSGSRIIVTTRDKHVLTKYGITHIYKVDELREDEATELFESKAFQKHQQMGGYEGLVRRAVKYAKGVPLALKVLGSFLCGRNKDLWESELNKLKESPLNEVRQVLRISYDALESKVQDIFLDIACFFKGEDKNDVTKILESCGFDPIIGIAVLVEKSLITISGNNELLMHDLIQELGWYIVREQSPKEPGNHTRLWLDEDIKRVLMDNEGTSKVEGIFMQYGDLRDLDPKDIRFLKQLKLRPKAFEKMSNLRILKICCPHLSEELKYLSNKLSYLDWLGYPMKYMPSTFQPEHLVELHLTYSSIEQLWEGKMHLGKLRIMNLSHSTSLTKIPDFTEVPNLERLILEGCTGLVNLHPSFGILKRLICLNLEDCKSLKIGHLTNLHFISLIDCENLRSIPNSICQLKGLECLYLSGCSKLDKLPQDMGDLDCLKVLCASWTAIRQLPSSIGRLKKLDILWLHGCKGLSSNSWSSFLPYFLRREIDNSMASELAAWSGLESLRELDLSYCNLKSIPTGIGHISSLYYLNLDGNNMKGLPASMNQLSRLTTLCLSDCKKLQELTEMPSGIRSIYALNCPSLRTIWGLYKCNTFNVLDFENCFKLVEKQNNILTEKYISNRLQKKREDEEAMISHDILSLSYNNIRLPGREIPKWFSHQRRGSSISFQLPPHWFNNSFLGFALAAVGSKKVKSEDEGDGLLIKMRWKCHVTQRIIEPFPDCFGNVSFGHIGVTVISRGEFLALAEDRMEELNEDGIQFDVSLHSNKSEVGVEKVGVHVIYKEAEEQVGSSSSATTSKRRRDDDLNDNHYDAAAAAAAGPSGSPGIDDQEDHLNNLNSKRLRIDKSMSSNNDAGFFQNQRCKCRKKAGVYISESEKNPGNMYFKCANKACDYFAWGVPPTENGSNIQKSGDDYDFARNNEVKILEQLDANQRERLEANKFMMLTTIVMLGVIMLAVLLK